MKSAYTNPETSYAECSKGVQAYIDTDEVFLATQELRIRTHQLQSELGVAQAAKRLLSVNFAASRSSSLTPFFRRINFMKSFAKLTSEGSMQKERWETCLQLTEPTKSRLPA